MRADLLSVLKQLETESYLELAIIIVFSGGAINLQLTEASKLFFADIKKSQTCFLLKHWKLDKQYQILIFLTHRRYQKKIKTHIVGYTMQNY